MYECVVSHMMWRVGDEISESQYYNLSIHGRSCFRRKESSADTGSSDSSHSSVGAFMDTGPSYSDSDYSDSSDSSHSFDGFGDGDGGGAGASGDWSSSDSGSSDSGSSDSGGCDSSSSD